MLYRIAELASIFFRRPIRRQSESCPDKNLFQNIPSTTPTLTLPRKRERESSRW
ncbi:hypothetical protein NEISICOT_02302 [Neisseria sicca ATCC 29256]|uniref:Uncharacterized protein n=1 Tax=Neisseria sicca ATCC 29256 TaxID=547045 RepID=C6M6Z8_NEISI|nr:hypothetical protein NEISICOT_02302 [Neisseria sicca ATCC 29256]